MPMSSGLHAIRPPRGAVRRPKRIGRGLGSGHGTFSTRGIKGQRARSGGRRGIGKRTIKHLIMRLPKFKGMKPWRPKIQHVTTGQLEAHFAPNARVDVPALVAAGLIDPGRRGVKVLAAGELSQPLAVTATAFSRQARELIERAGGTTFTVESKIKNQKSRQRSAPKRQRS